MEPAPLSQACNSCVIFRNPNPRNSCVSDSDTHPYASVAGSEVRLVMLIQ